MTRLSVIEGKRAEPAHPSDQIVQANETAEATRSLAHEAAALAIRLHALADRTPGRGRNLRASADRLFVEAAKLHEEARMYEAQADRLLKSCFPTQARSAK